MRERQSDAIIATHSVSRHFGATIALNALSLQVHSGEVFGILGHNGAGKTTFLRLVTGLLRPTSGCIETFGHEAYDNGRQIRSRTGVVTESTALDDFLTVRENLVSHGTMLGVEPRRVDGRVDHLLAVFDLTDVAGRQTRELSAGMRQRAAVARGLVHEPELLLLDEPTANLDPVAARQVRQIVTDLARDSGTTVVLSTHNLAEAQDVCDRIAVLRRGCLQAMGSMAQLSDLVGRGTCTSIVTTDRAHSHLALTIASGFGEVVVNGHPEKLTIRHAVEVQVPALVNALVRAGVPVYGVSQAVTTLEDVYIALHGQKDSA